MAEELRTGGLGQLETDGKVVMKGSTEKCGSGMGLKRGKGRGGVKGSLSDADDWKRQGSAMVAAEVVVVSSDEESVVCPGAKRRCRRQREVGVGGVEVKEEKMEVESGRNGLDVVEGLVDEEADGEEELGGGSEGGSESSIGSFVVADNSACRYWALEATPTQTELPYLLQSLSNVGNVMVSEPPRLVETPQSKAAVLADTLAQSNSAQSVETNCWSYLASPRKRSQARPATTLPGSPPHFDPSDTAIPHDQQPIVSHVCHCHPLHQIWIIFLTFLLRIDVAQAAVLPSQSSNSSVSSNSESSFKDWPYILVVAFIALGAWEAGRRFNNAWKLNSVAMALSAIIYLKMVGVSNVSGLVTWTYSTWVFCALFTALFAWQDSLELDFGQWHMVFVFLAATIIDSFLVRALQLSSATSGGNAFFEALLPWLAFSFFTCGRLRERLRDAWRNWPLQWRNQALELESV